MTLYDLLNEGSAALQQAGDTDGENDAKLLLFEALHLDLVHFLMDRLRPLSEQDAKVQEQTEPERAEAERVEAEIVYSPMVAEPQEYQYNADAFEARGVDDVKQEAAHNDVSKVREDKAR